MLLRVLETGEVQPLGDETPGRVRVRVIAATNRDLDEEVRAGRFREDLYYRVAVVKLHVPPLRDRRDDIEPLAARFASAFGAPALPTEVVQRLKARPWPGNARELRNVVQAFAILGTLPEDVGAGSGALEQALANVVDLAREYTAQKEEVAERFTRVYLQALLAQTGGNQTAAARIAGLDRTYLGRLLVKHGLSKT
jgi:DNA-binding NtrC family response regulator